MAGVKALPWIAVIVLAVIAAVMFRFQMVEFRLPERRTRSLDRARGIGPCCCPNARITLEPDNRRRGVWSLPEGESDREATGRISVAHFDGPNLSRCLRGRNCGLVLGCADAYAGRHEVLCSIGFL
jgi:hypothetical protein